MEVKAHGLVARYLATVTRGMRVEECPVDAIFPEEEVPPGQKHFLELNRQLAPNGPCSRCSDSQCPSTERRLHRYSPAGELICNPMSLP